MINYSIIIPHYNIPELLIRCINSIPVREDIQVIVVDDGSIGGGNYSHIYKQLSRPYLEYYHYDQHMNAGHARNVGLERAKGKWLVFADADDFFTEEFSSILDKYVNAEEDILYFKSRSCYSNDLSKEANRAEYNQLINNFLKSDIGSEEDIRLRYYAPWAKLIKKKLVDDHQIRFAEVKYSNDSYFSVKTGLKARKITCIDEYIYVVTYRSGSLTSKSIKNAEELENRIDVLFGVQKLILDCGYDMKKHPATDLLPRAIVTNPAVFWKCWNRISRSGITKREAFVSLIREHSRPVMTGFLLIFILTCPLSLFYHNK